jgi:hypothetical protein
MFCLQDPKVSPFHPESSSYPQEDKQSKPSFFAKLCGGCGGEEVEDDYRGGHAAAHPSSKNQVTPYRTLLYNTL